MSDHARSPRTDPVHPVSVESLDPDAVRGHLIDVRHVSGILTDLRRTGTDTYELSLVLGGGDDCERRTLRDVRTGESVIVHDAA